MSPHIVGVLLAAGESRRMGFPKPLLPIDETTFVGKLCQTLLSAVPKLVVVIGAHADKVRPHIPMDTRILIVENPSYRQGQLSSLKIGLKTADASTKAILVHLVDHPLIRVDTVKAVIECYERGSGLIVIPRYKGKRGHPVIFDRRLFDELANAPESEGARVVVNKDPARVAYVEVDDEGVVLDLDYPTDLGRLGLRYPSE